MSNADIIIDDCWYMGEQVKDLIDNLIRIEEILNSFGGPFRLIATINETEVIINPCEKSEEVMERYLKRHNM